MASEIERKYLVAGDGWRTLVKRRRSIRQGYIGGANVISVRVRLYDDAVAVLTLKSEREGIRRSEFEYTIPKHDALQLLDLAQGSTIEKTRYEVPAAGLVWEIDVFEGQNAGLVLAEIELTSTDQAFVKPSWLGVEVTHDERYYNSNLARTPFQSW